MRVFGIRSEMRSDSKQCFASAVDEFSGLASDYCKNLDSQARYFKKLDTQQSKLHE